MELVVILLILLLPLALTVGGIGLIVNAAVSIKKTLGK